MRNPFGWDLPAGAAGDPRAPWNEPDDEHHPDCPQSIEYDEDDIKCFHCEEKMGEGVCYLYDWFHHKVAEVLRHIWFLKGLSTKGHCEPDTECRCEELGWFDEDEPDYDPFD